MNSKTTYDFDLVVSRDGTHAEKYEARKRLFGDPDAEPFWVADMDLPSPGFLVDALKSRVSHPMFGYTEQYTEVFDAIVWWMDHEHGLQIEKSHLRLSPSVVTSIVMGVLSMTRPGDAVLIPSPVYGPFFFATEHCGREVVDFPMDIIDGQFSLDLGRLEETIEKENVKLLLLCNPHNPGGRVWKNEELEAVVGICRKKGTLIFSDEIHSDIVYPPGKHAPILSVEGAKEICVVAHSIGKTFNTSGLQASFTMIPNDDLRNTFAEATQRAHANDVNLLGKVALEACLSPDGARYKRQLVDYLKENTRLVHEKLIAVEGLQVMEPQATFLVWFDCRKLGKWHEVMKILLKDAKVALSGGTFFGPAGEGWFRINCAHPKSKLLPAVDRIVKALTTK